MALRTVVFLLAGVCVTPITDDVLKGLCYQKKRVVSVKHRRVRVTADATLQQNVQHGKNEFSARAITSSVSSVERTQLQLLWFSVQNRGR